MKKNILVFLLVVLTLFTFSGCEKNNRVRALTVENDDIALLSIFSDDGKSESSFFLRNYGHAFLSVTNISGEAFVVGDQEVMPDETITIGLWNVLNHYGVWYNIESNYIDEYSKYPERVSLTIGIDGNDIKTISDIIDKNDRWTPLFNCSKFALKAWNSVAEESERIDNKLFVSPGYLVEEISKFECFEKARECVTAKNVRFYKEV